MTTQEKNKEIAKMLGFQKGFWYSVPNPSEDTKQYCKWDKENTFFGSKVYPKEKLLFHSDYNWILEACKFITEKYDAAWKITSKFCQIHNHSNGFDCWNEINCPENPILDIFECLYQFSQYIKNK